jgi:hypothetical protein
MSLAIQANEGDWGEAQLSATEAVSISAADGFAAYDDGGMIAITLKPMASEDDLPRTLSGHRPWPIRGPAEILEGISEPGSPISRSGVPPRASRPTTRADRDGRFAWIREALCETA